MWLWIGLGLFWLAGLLMLLGLCVAAARGDKQIEEMMRRRKDR